MTAQNNPLAGFAGIAAQDFQKFRVYIAWGFAAIILIVLADTQLYPLALMIGIVVLIYFAAEGLLTPVIQGFTKLVTMGN